MRLKQRTLSLILAGAMVALALPAAAQAPSDAELKSLKGDVKKSSRAALKFLQSKFDAKTGTWESTGPGMTGVVLLAFLRSPDKYKADEAPFVGKPLAYLMGMQKDDGGIRDPKLGVPNYVTSIAILAMVAARDNGIADAALAKKIDTAIEKARGFLVKLQADEGEGYTPKDKMYGGVGYGGDLRPDLSNTQLAIEAVKAAGLDSKDEFYKKAMKFLNRCQNNSETNDQKFAKGTRSGDFVYYPGKTYAKGGTGGKLQGYGSMTYAGLKSFIYAGLEWDDQRVQSALEWIGKNYTVKENPKVGALGLYYYFHTFAKTMSVYSAHTGSPYLKDASGRKHHWQNDLGRHLISLQAKDGSWKNATTRWMEGNPVLATAYAVLALSYCSDPIVEKKSGAKKDGGAKTDGGAKKGDK